MTNLNSINSLNITELIIISTLDSLSEFQLDSNTQRAHRHGVKLPHDSHDGTSLQGGQRQTEARVCLENFIFKFATASHHLSAIHPIFFNFTQRS